MRCDWSCPRVRSQVRPALNNVSCPSAICTRYVLTLYFGDSTSPGWSNSDGKWKSKDSLFSRWTTNNTLLFETNSNWGHPKTLSFNVSTLSKSTSLPDVDAHDHSELGCGFVDLCPVWKRSDGVVFEARTKINLFDSAEEFDQHGETIEASARSEEVRLIQLVLISAL